MSFLHQLHFKQVNNSPKSMNCFIDSGDGENFENLSTCLGMFSFELFFSMIWANFMLIFKWNPQILKCSLELLSCWSHQMQFAKFGILAQPVTSSHKWRSPQESGCDWTARWKNPSEFGLICHCTKITDQRKVQNRVQT